MQKQTSLTESTNTAPYCSLPKLPFDLTALEPFMSAQTLEFHYGKHHKGYVDKLNELIHDTDFDKMSLEDVIRQTKGALYNNAAQVWNHTFFWNCLTPQATEPKSGQLLSSITETFGSLDDFKKQFTDKGIAHFGSGYVWLVSDNEGKLSVITGDNAYNPLVDNLVPLLTCDLWEHAYYLDYQNKRPEFLANFWKMVNWDFVESKLSQLH